MSSSRFHPVPYTDDDLIDMSREGYGEKPDHTALPVPSLPQAPPKQWVPASIKPPSIATLLVVMVCYVVGLEVALLISTTRNGFDTNAIDRVNAGQFVDSFLPVIIILPLVFMLTKVDLEIRRLQPYIAISEGNASADKSILLDYVGNGRFYILWQSLKNGHFPVLLSTLVVLTTMLFQPLAAGMFSTRLTNVTWAGNVTGTTAVIGLRPGFLDLNAFAAASGYADAASVHGLSDPPFINGGWSTGRFSLPDLPFNTTGVVNVTTTGIQTVANCQTADNVNIVKNQDGSFVITPSWGSCTTTVTIPLRPAPFVHYSVNTAANCGNIDKNAPNERKPVAFVFYNFDGPSPVGQSFFCIPTIRVFGIAAVQSLTTGLITSVKSVATYDGPDNNVTALAAQPYNGVFFPASDDPFVQARALAVQSGVPGAIFRTTFDYLPGGNPAALQDVDHMFKLTTRIYTQHLAISAAEIYFLKEAVILPALITLFQPRLFIYAPPVHSLVALLILTLLLTAVVHISHYRLRRKLFLSTAPGTIGSAVSLTSQARFGALLNATDSRHDMSRKLKGLRFGYDPNTWQIIVEGEKAEKAQLLNKGGLETPGTPVTPATKRSSGRESYFGSIVSPKPNSTHFPRESQMLTPGVVPPLPPSPLSPRFNPSGPAAQQQQQPRPSLGAAPEQARTSTTSLQPPPPGAANPGYFPSGPGAYPDPYHPEASKRA